VGARALICLGEGGGEVGAAHEIMIELKRYEIATLLSVARNNNLAMGPALRPSAMAHTISDWPHCMSPAVKAPSVCLTLLYTSSETAIPANAGIHLKKTGFRVKPGMTIIGKRRSTHYPSVVTRTFLYTFHSL
jgi:hypothetical protein